MPADNDADAIARRNSDTEHVNGPLEVDGHNSTDTDISADINSDTSAATTEHLRRLWMAGARDITVTYDADVVRHRTYLSHPRTDI